MPARRLLSSRLALLAALTTVPLVAADAFARPPALDDAAQQDPTRVPPTPVDTPTSSAGTPPPGTPPPGTPPPDTPSPGPTATPAPAPPLGDELGVSGMQLANRSTTDTADFTITFHDQAGRAPVTIRRSDVAPGSSLNVYLPLERDLPDGVFAASAASDEPMAAIARSDWPASARSVIYNAPEPATEVLLPFVPQGFNGDDTAISIQNTDADTPVVAVLDLMRDGATAPTRSLRLLLPAGGATTVLTDRHPELTDLPDGILTWARVRAATPVAVLATIGIEGEAPAAYNFAGVPAHRAGSRLLAPMLLAGYPTAPGGPGAGTITTAVAVLNPGDRAVMVKLTYRAATAGANAAACRGATWVHDNRPLAIAPGALMVFYQGDVALPGSGRSGLPRGCAATGEIESTGGPVVAIVNAADVSGGMRSAAYAAAPAGAGDARAILPLIRRQHTGDRMTTAIQVMNAGNAPANAALRVWISTGQLLDCPVDCAATIPPGGGKLWWPDDIAAWPANSYGAAEVLSDKPVLVIVHDLSERGVRDSALYQGLTGAGRRAASLPLVLKGGKLGDVPQMGSAVAAFLPLGLKGLAAP